MNKVLALLVVLVVVSVAAAASWRVREPRRPREQAKFRKPVINWTDINGEESDISRQNWAYITNFSRRFKKYKARKQEIEESDVQFFLNSWLNALNKSGDDTEEESDRNAWRSRRNWETIKALRIKDD